MKLVLKVIIIVVVVVVLFRKLFSGLSIVDCPSACASADDVARVYLLHIVVVSLLGLAVGLSVVVFFTFVVVLVVGWAWIVLVIAWAWIVSATFLAPPPATMASPSRVGLAKMRLLENSERLWIFDLLQTVRFLSKGGFVRETSSVQTQL